MGAEYQAQARVSDPTERTRTVAECPPVATKSAKSVGAPAVELEAIVTAKAGESEAEDKKSYLILSQTQRWQLPPGCKQAQVTAHTLLGA